MSYYYTNPYDAGSSGGGGGGVLGSGRSTVGYAFAKSVMAKQPLSITAPTNPKLPPQAPAPVANLALDTASNSNLSVKSTPNHTNNTNTKQSVPNSGATASTSALAPHINYMTYNLDNLKLNSSSILPPSAAPGLSKNMSSANIYTNNTYNNSSNKFLPVYPRAKKSIEKKSSHQYICAKLIET
jgi:hypothetical protein